MREALTRKHHRQRALARLVAGQRLRTQSELVEALRRDGFPATQATVSRDILELGLVKVARDGDHAYASPDLRAGSDGTGRLRRFCEDERVDATVAGNLVVLRSSPGTANALAAALDASRFAQVIGTVAGDDTVFAATRDPRAARGLVRRLCEFGVEAVEVR